MKYFILFFPIFLHSAEIKIIPSFYINHFTNGGEYLAENTPANFSGWEVKGNYKKNKFSIESSFSAHGIWKYRPKVSDLTIDQAVPYYNSYMENIPELSIYWRSKVYLEYKLNNFALFSGNRKLKWGEGQHPIFFSGKPINYINSGININLNEKLELMYVFGILEKQYIEIADTDNGIYKYKSLAGHKLNYRINKNFRMSFFESVIFDRALDFNYLNPFMFYYPVSRIAGNNDNNQIGMELIFDDIFNSNFHLSLLIDEWDPDFTFKENHENWFVYQFGWNKQNVIFSSDKILCEYTWADNRVYINKNSDVDYFLDGYPLGFWAGPHAEHLFLKYQFKYINTEFSISMSEVKKGRQLTPEDITYIYGHKGGNYDRYFGGVEEKFIFGITAEMQISKNHSYLLGLNYLEWTNNLNDETAQTFNLNKFYINCKFNYFLPQLNLN